MIDTGEFVVVEFGPRDIQAAVVVGARDTSVEVENLREPRKSGWFPRDKCKAYPERTLRELGMIG